MMEVTIIRSNRKTVGIRVNDDQSVTVRAPRRARKSDIDEILQKNEEWIRKSMERIKADQIRMQEEGIKKLTQAQMRELADRALEYIPGRVEFYSEMMGVQYGKITIRNQKTRWGSCSSKGNLNFNCLLMLTPPEVIDYVVVHELCHRKEMNHSTLFWREVEKILPDYRKSRQWLKKEGSLIIRSRS